MENKFVLPRTSVAFSYYTGNTSWSVYSGKALMELMAKCAWLKHDWDGAVDEAADFTGCVCKTREGFVSPTCESRREGRLFLHEYQVEECDAEPLVALITNSCKLHIPLLPLNPPGPRNQSSRTGLGSADIIVFAFAALSGSWVWCNWCSLLEITVA